MRYDVHIGSYLQVTALVYCSSWSTVQLMSLRMIICWLSLLPELIEPRSVRNVDGKLCRNLVPVRPGACPSLRSGNGPISMALCDFECLLRCAEALMAVEREALLDLLLHPIFDNTFPAREAWPVLSSEIVVPVMLSPRRNGRILGIVAEVMDQYSSS